MATNRYRKTRWPRGLWMRVISGDRLRTLIANKGLSYQQFADDVKTDEVRCSKSMVGHLCTGERTSCTPELAERIARRLEVPIDVLFVPSISLDAGHSLPQRRKKVAA